MRDIMLIIHFLGVAMGLGTSFAHLFLGIMTAKLDPQEANTFRLRSLVLSNMGYIGLAFLLVSGTYLIIPYWDLLPEMPLLIAKLALVLVLIFLLILISIASGKAKRGDSEKELKKMESIGKFTFIIAISILVLAVKVFH